METERNKITNCLVFNVNRRGSSRDLEVPPEFVNLVFNQYLKTRFFNGGQYIGILTSSKLASPKIYMHYREKTIVFWAKCA